MVKYFENIKTAEELKTTYKNLVKQYHPDVYGDKGNDIMKDVHNQLEKALRQIDKGFFDYEGDYIDADREETAETRAKKEKIVKEVIEKHKGLAYLYLFVAYYKNGLKPSNHRNPLTKHNFSGWNIWQLELKMILNDFTSSKWSTFAQYKNAKTNVKKGEHGTTLTLAIYAKNKQAEDEEENENKKQKVYYKAYNVFNIAQTQETPKAKLLIQTKAIETKNTEPQAEEQKIEDVIICRMHTVNARTGETTHDYNIVADKNNNIKKVLPDTEPTQQKLNVWANYEVVA